MELAKWICFSIILLIMIISIVLEFILPYAFGITTFFSLLPSAIIAGVTNFKWWMIFIEIIVAIVCWIIIYFFMNKFFYKKRKNNPDTFDFLDKLKTVETMIVESTSNKNGTNQYGTIKVDDKIYRVLPYDEETSILSNQKVKIIDLKGNVCLVRKVGV